MSFNTRSKLTVLLMLVTAAKDVHIKLSDPLFVPRICEQGFTLFCFTLVSAGFRRNLLSSFCPSYLVLIYCQGKELPGSLLISRMLCQLMQKGLRSLIPGFIPAVCRASGSIKALSREFLSSYPFSDWPILLLLFLHLSSHQVKQK